jgi:hypothetical protein
MNTIEYRNVVDKSTWGPGPWNNEPDKAQWQDEATKLPCLIVRNGGVTGSLCGYVGVPQGHPLYGKGDVDVDVHGGLTFASGCSHGPEDQSICHIPAPGESDNVWWFGFDCGHAYDLAPALQALLPRVLPDDLMSRLQQFHLRDVYRDFAYVKAEVTQLAAQLASDSA